MRLIWFRPVPGDSVIQFVGVCVKRTKTGKERVIPRTERGKEREEASARETEKWVHIFGCIQNVLVGFF